MTTEELRALADRREALADACGVGSNWSGRLCEDADDAAFVTANSPTAAIASVQRDRLLADCIAALRNIVDHGDPLPNECELVARFDALEAKP